MMIDALIADHRIARAFDRASRQKRQAIRNAMRAMPWASADEIEREIRRCSPLSLSVSMSIDSMQSGAAFSPTQIAGLLAWYDAGRGITLNAGNVSALADQSGTGDANKHAVQSTSTTQPLYVASDAAYNNKPTIDFATAGVPSQVVLATGTWTTPMSGQGTIYFVGHTTSTVSYPIAVGANGGTTFVVDRVGTATTTPLTLFAQDTAVCTTPKIYCVTCDSAGNTAGYVNAITAATATGVHAFTTINSLTLGNYSPSGGNPWSGKFANLLLYSTPHTAAQRGQVMNYLGTAYGITVAA